MASTRRTGPHPSKPPATFPASHRHPQCLQPVPPKRQWLELERRLVQRRTGPLRLSFCRGNSGPQMTRMPFGAVGFPSERVGGGPPAPVLRGPKDGPSLSDGQKPGGLRPRPTQEVPPQRRLRFSCSRLRGSVLAAASPSRWLQAQSAVGRAGKEILSHSSRDVMVEAAAEHSGARVAVSLRNLLT